jgi:type IV secretory pathway VirB10-like protein
LEEDADGFLCPLCRTYVDLTAEPPEDDEEEESFVAPLDAANQEDKLVESLAAVRLEDAGDGTADRRAMGVLEDLQQEQQQQTNDAADTEANTESEPGEENKEGPASLATSPMRMSWWGGFNRSEGSSQNQR